MGGRHNAKLRKHKVTGGSSGQGQLSRQQSPVGDAFSQIAPLQQQFPVGDTLSTEVARGRASRQELMAQRRRERQESTRKELRLEEQAKLARSAKAKLTRSAKARGSRPAKRAKSAKKAKLPKRVVSPSTQRHQRGFNFSQNYGKVAYKYWKQYFEQPLAAEANFLYFQGSDLRPVARDHQIYHRMNARYLELFNQLVAEKKIPRFHDKAIRGFLSQKYYKPIWNFLDLLLYYSRRFNSGIPISDRVKQRLYAMAEQYRDGLNTVIEPGSDIEHFLNTQIITAGYPIDTAVIDQADAELAQLLVQLSLTE